MNKISQLINASGSVSQKEAGQLVGSFLDNLAGQIGDQSGGGTGSQATGSSGGGSQGGGQATGNVGRQQHQHFEGLPNEGAPSPQWLKALAQQCRNIQQTT